MLRKLERKTLSITQILGYFLSLLIGVSILLLTVQVYFDFKPVLVNDTNVFKSNAAVISKKITAFKSLNKDRMYFSEEELRELENQEFVEGITTFTSANFKISAFSEQQENLPSLYSDLFFESIPGSYLDVAPEKWQWDSTSNFIPIVVPEDYLKLYNFGFAESQNLPVLSKRTISQISFKIRVSGNNQSQIFDSKIVDYSTKINSILVPQEFLGWANKKFGTGQNKRTSRVLVDFSNPSDERIIEFFNSNNYSINKEKLEMGKLSLFFKSSIFAVFFISIIIVVLSIGFLILSMNLLFQKNKKVFVNLLCIGYSSGQIARFYQVLVSAVTLLAVLCSLAICNLIRNKIIQSAKQFIDFQSGTNYIIILGLILALVLILIYSFTIVKGIKKMGVYR